MKTRQYMKDRKVDKPWYEKPLPESGKVHYMTAFACISLLVISLVYTLLLGRGIFYFQESRVLFIFSTGYVSNFTNIPGGLLVYAGNFLTQFYYYPVIGSAIYALLLCLSFHVFRKLTLVSDAGQLPVLLAYLPVSAVLLLQSEYYFHIYHLLGFILSSGWFIISSRRFSGPFRILSFPFLYFLTGSYAFIFALMISIHSVYFTRAKLRLIRLSSITVVCAVTYFIFREFVFLQQNDRFLTYPLFVSENGKMNIVFILLSSYLVLLPVISDIISKSVSGKAAGRYAVPVGLILTVLAVVIFLLNTYDPVIANVSRFDRLAEERNWDAIILEHEKIQSDNVIEQYYYNLSLAEKGELCSRMFFGRQSNGSLALTLARTDEQSHRSMLFYYAVGLSCEAHRLAYEQMVQHGYRPDNIKMLILTDLIGGNYAVAERYIRVMKKTLFYRIWVQKYERMPGRPDAIKADHELGRQISLLPLKDFYIQSDDFRNIDMLLESNPGNIPAFEYYLARLLCEKDLVEIGKEVRKLKEKGYQRIPRHIEEAIVSLVNVTGEFPDLGGLEISKETDQRFLAYFDRLKAFHNDRKLVQKGIKKEERNTFWFYLQFGHAGKSVLTRGDSDQSIY
jgi:hypothetical protein